MNKLRHWQGKVISIIKFKVNTNLKADKLISNGQNQNMYLSLIVFYFNCNLKVGIIFFYL